LPRLPAKNGGEAANLRAKARFFCHFGNGYADFYHISLHRISFAPFYTVSAATSE